MTYESATVEGHGVQVCEGGLCWYCEEAEPSVAARTTVGPLSMDIGVCENCHDKLSEEINHG